MKTISIYFFSLSIGLLFTVLNLKAQKDTVYLVTNGVTYNQMPANFVSLDTFNQKVDSVSFSNLLVGGSATATFSDTAGTAYNHYFIRYTVNELQGGNSGFLSVDTNGTQRSFTALSTVTGVFLDDTLEIGSGGTIDYVLSAASSATALQIQGEIYHETTFILIRPEALRTVYWDPINQQLVPPGIVNPGRYRIDSSRYDTLYYYNSGVQNIWLINNMHSETMPVTYSSYMANFSMTYMGGGFSFTVDTNSTTYISGNSGNLITPIKDSLILKSADVIDFNISNVSNSGRYQLEVEILHTVDSIFLTNLLTSLDGQQSTEKLELNLYPNPTSDVIRLSTLNSTSGSYRVCNLQGQLLQSGHIKKQIVVSDLPSGVYFLHLPDLGVSKKFLKN